MIRFDRDHLLRQLHWLHPAGALVEVRLLPNQESKRRVPAYDLFEDFHELAARVSPAPAHADEDQLLVELGPAHPASDPRGGDAFGQEHAIFHRHGDD